MSLIIYFFFFFILNYSLVLNIDTNTNCENGRYYNSMEYKCEDCNGEKGINICYSNTNRISIYTFKTINEKIRCNNGDVLTELDGNRKLLKEPVCANQTFNYNDINNSYISHSPSGNIYLSIENGRIIDRYEEDEFNYYNKSCLDGKNERACDYAANLCALSLYYDINRDNNNVNFCGIVKDLDTILHNEGIL